METIETMFRDATVAELLSDSSSVTPLCEERKVFKLDTALVASPSGRKSSNKSKKKS
jgi:hypothetical protein